MRSRIALTTVAVLGVATLGLATVGCGDGSSGTSPTTTLSPATTTTPGSTLAPDVLADLLLTAEQVGDGWVVSNPVNDADRAAFAEVPCQGVSVDADVAERLVATTGVQFEPSDHAYRHLLELVVTGDEHRLAADLDALFGVIESCPATATDPAAVTTTVGAPPIPAFGEQRLSFTARGAESPAGVNTWLVRVGIVRDGNAALLLGLTEVLPTADDAPQVTDAEFVRILDQAVADLTGA